MSDKNSFVFTDQDRAAVLHFILHGNKNQAYKFSRMGQYTGKSNNLYNISNRFFNSDKIKVLLNIEIERFKNNVDEIFDRLGMKKEEDQNNKKQNKIIDIDEKLDKTKAIAILVDLINSNKTDAKTIKDAMTLLSRLEQWDKEKPDVQSNVIQYQIPIKDKVL